MVMIVNTNGFSVSISQSVFEGSSVVKRNMRPIENSVSWFITCPTTPGCRLYILEAAALMS